MKTVAEELTAIADELYAAHRAELSGVTRVSPARSFALGVAVGSILAAAREYRAQPPVHTEVDT